MLRVKQCLRIGQSFYLFCKATGSEVYLLWIYLQLFQSFLLCFLLFYFCRLMGDQARTVAVVSVSLWVCTLVDGMQSCEIIVCLPHPSAEEMNKI